MTYAVAIAPSAPVDCLVYGRAIRSDPDVGYEGWHDFQFFVAEAEILHRWRAGEGGAPALSRGVARARWRAPPESQPLETSSDDAGGSPRRPQGARPPKEIGLKSWARSPWRANSSPRNPERQSMVTLSRAKEGSELGFRVEVNRSSTIPLRCDVIEKASGEEEGSSQEAAEGIGRFVGTFWRFGCR